MIFLLGGEGFIGSAYARFFQLNKIKFEVITRSNYNRLTGSSCNLFINANGNSKKYLANNDPKSEFQYSVTSVKNSLIDFKFKKYIFLSTSDIYPDCSNPSFSKEDSVLNVMEQSAYGFHKYLAEQCVQNYANDWLIIRQGGFVGHGLKKNPVYDILFTNKIWIHPESELQFINTDTSAQLVMELVDLDISNQIINLTSKGVIMLKEIIRLFNKEIEYDESLVPIKYEISTEKASRYLNLPNTSDVITDFLKTIKI